MKSLANQVSELVTFITHDLDFIDDLFHNIKKFIISQLFIEKETWTNLIDHALYIEKTLSFDYQLTFNRFISIFSDFHRGFSQLAHFDRLDNSDRLSNFDHFGN